MGKRRAIIIVVVLFLIAGMFAGLGGWQIHKYLNCDRFKKIDKFNDIIDEWNTKYRAEFAQATRRNPQPSFAPSEDSFSNSTGVSSFYFTISKYQMNVTIDNFSANATLNDTIYVALPFDPVTTLQESLNDTKKGKGIDKWEPLAFVLHNTSFLLEPYYNTKNTYYAYFNIYYLPEPLDGNCPQQLPLDNLIVSAPVGTLNKARDEENKSWTQTSCNANGGAWSNTTNLCTLLLKPTNYCTRVMYGGLSDDGSNGADDQYNLVNSSAVGCMGPDYYPLTQEFAYKLDNKTFIGPDIVVRHHKDPYLQAAVLTDYSFDFGEEDRQSKVYAIAFFAASGFTIIIGIIAVILAMRKPQIIDPFGDYR